MTAWRHHLMTHRAFTLWLIAAAMIMTALVPAGFMPVASAGRITLVLCSGTGPQAMTMAMPGMDHRNGKGGDHGKAEQPCAFASAGAPTLAAADPIILALAIAFILATGFVAERSVRVASPAFLRPPLRGPPPTF